MIKIKSYLSKKEKDKIYVTLQELPDFYSDFYITKERIRLDIKENIDIFMRDLKKGNKLVYGEQEGIACIVGYADKFPRKYLKILPRTMEGADKLVKVALQNVSCDLWAKIKKDNPLVEILRNNKFIVKGNRGREILLVRKVYHPQKSEKNNA